MLNSFHRWLSVLFSFIAVVSLLQLSAPSPLDDSQIVNDKSKVRPSCMMYACETMRSVQGK